MRKSSVPFFAAALLGLAGCGGGGSDSPAPIAPRADVSVVVRGPADNLPSGTAAGFSVVVTNGGPDAASSVAINLTPSASLTLGSIGCTSAGGAACPSTIGTSMSLASFPAGGALTFAVPGNVTLGASGSVSLAATVTATNDTQSNNNSGTATATVYSADVNLTASAPSGSVAGGSVANFGIVVGNAGPDTARNVALAIAPGANLSAGALSCTASGGASCPSALSINMTIPSLPNGGALTISVPATVTAGTNSAVSLAATATAAGDPSPSNNSATATATAFSANLSVSNTTSASVGGGGTAFFRATVANSGPSAAQNVSIVASASSGYSVGAVTCTATGGASCPTAVGSTTAVPTLPVGSSLALTIPVAIPSGTSGTVTTTVTVTAAGDPVDSNNSAIASTTAVAPDARNGSYYVYATNGALYSLAIDFNAQTYAMVGPSGGTGASTQIGSFTADAAGGGYTIAGNARFRTPTDLIVGGFDFGGGVKPFVAARNLATTPAELTGEFVFLGINLPNTGNPSSRIFPGQLNGSTWTICFDAVIYTLANCPPASIWTYTLTATGVDGEWLAVDSVHSDTVRFRLAKSGSERIFLRAGDAADSSGKRFRIGLPNVAGIASTTYFASGSRGEWVTLNLSDTTYSASGSLPNGSAISDSAPLLPISGVVGLLGGRRTSDNAFLFTVRSASVFALVGAQSGPADGSMQIGAK